MNEPASSTIQPRRPQRQQQQSSTRTQAALPRQSLVIAGSIRNRPRKGFAIAGILLVLVSCWIVCFVSLLAGSDNGSSNLLSVSDLHGQIGRYRSGLRKQQTKSEPQKEGGEKHHDAIVAPKSHLVSRMPNKVVATADVRGNLGPATVVVQAKPGTDWIHDRWQAASNMHGKQIPGEHWIQLEFQNTTVVADKIVLDWETAYADEYVLEASLEPIAKNPNNQNVWILFDGRKKEDSLSMRSVTESGRSPGVKEQRPLHVVHEIQLTKNKSNHHTKPFHYLRLHILKSVTGWGVSLWQFDVYGLHASKLQTAR